MKPRRTTMATAALLTTVALAISGCGSGSGSSSDPAGTGTAQPRPPGVDPAQMKAIQKCLKAAGLGQSFPQGAPSDLPSNLPSGAPTDVPSNFSGGPGGQFNDPKIQAALKACGIQVPTLPGG